MELMAAISIIWTANVDCQSIHPPIGTPLPDPAGCDLVRASSYQRSGNR
jgi:hypothetical protein